MGFGKIHLPGPDGNRQCMVLDRENRIAYACLSPRTDEKLLNEFCRILGYSPVTFTSTDGGGIAIYHTNVMMCIAKTFAVICLASIRNAEERKMVVSSLQRTNKEIVDITSDQLNHFAGNVLQVKDVNGNLLLVMSAQAYNSLTKKHFCHHTPGAAAPGGFNRIQRRMNDTVMLLQHFNLGSGKRIISLCRHHQ